MADTMIIRPEKEKLDLVQEIIRAVEEKNLHIYHGIPKGDLVKDRLRMCLFCKGSWELGKLNQDKVITFVYNLELSDLVTGFIRSLCMHNGIGMHLLSEDDRSDAESFHLNLEN